MGARKWRARAIAWGVVLAWHALVAWWLLHGLRLPRNGEGSSLQVVYLELPSPPPSPPPRAVATSPGALEVVVAPPEPPAAAVAVAPPRSPPSARAIRQQARDFVAAEHPIAFAPPEPLASRTTRHSTAPRESFRMRTRITPARVLAEVGKIIGGPDYVADPCPRHRRNIERLIASGDSPELRMELEYEREYCRP